MIGWCFMSTYMRFLFDFMSQFFSGITSIFMGIFKGIVNIFNIPEYVKVLKNYSGEFNVGQWILAAFAILIVFAIIALLLFLIILVIRKYIRVRKSLVEQESLLEEIGKLNRDVFKLTQEKEKLYAMKVSQIGLQPGTPLEEIEVDEEGNATENKKKEEDTGNQSRFFKLTQLDEEYANYQNPDFGNTFSLSELCETFRNFSASKMKLYYKIKIIRLFVAALGATRLVILQGISGTGKTSLPYAWGKFLKNDATIASVQPSWRDRTELFGFFNEFTKKFNETEVLSKMYEANYKDIVYLTILDEMNIARVEYYFAEMLSILEMPSRDEWIIDLVPNVWPNDPKLLKEGKLKIPDNMWYIGTINNDDSTFMVTDKVYDRAMPIDINDKGEIFDAPLTDGYQISSTYLENLFDSAMQEHKVSQDTLDKIELMDNYVIQHFRIAFGNRIMMHMKKFVPVYVACGGDEVSGVDYFVARKILRKFEQLNVAYIRDEIDDFVKFLNDKFGEGKMAECIDYLLRLKKMS